MDDTHVIAEELREMAAGDRWAEVIAELAIARYTTVSDQ